MTKTLLFQEKYCEIYMDDANRILCAKWSGFLRPEDIKKGCEFMTDYIKKNSIKLHFSDHVDLKVLMDDCKNYLTGEWFPAVEKIGLIKVAAMVSKSIYTRSSIDDVNGAVNLGNLTIETFNTVEDCYTWLKK